MLKCLSILSRIFRQPNQICSKISNVNSGSVIFPNVPLMIIPSRTTMIVKRRFPVNLYKEGNKPRLRRRTFFLDLEEDTENKPESLMDVVLTSNVPGVGNEGDILSMKRSQAYYTLLLPGLAGYPTKENLEYSRSIKKDEDFQKQLVSPSVGFCLQYLETRRISIVMNKETEWTIEPWHIRTSFRKAGVHVMSDDSIELPSKPITGPDMDLENKEFYVTITVNKNHKVQVRCCIHHWSTEAKDRLPYAQEFWLNPQGKVFPDEEIHDTVQPKPTTPT